MRNLRSNVRRLSVIAGICIVQALVGWVMPFAVAGDAVTVDIQVSPATIVLSSLGECLTIHADIALSEVDRASVTLNGLKPYLTKADARGQLVAKFDIDLVKAMVAPPSATFTLTGNTNDGGTFTGTSTNPVRE